MKRFENRSDVSEFWSLDNSSSKSVLDVLETIYLKFRINPAVNEPFTFSIVFDLNSVQSV